MAPRRTLGARDLAAKCGVKEATVRGWKRRGCPHGTRRGPKGRELCFNPDEVLAWCQANGITGAMGRPRAGATPSRASVGAKPGDPRSTEKPLLERPDGSMKSQLDAAELRRRNALASKHEFQLAVLRGQYTLTAEVESANVRKLVALRARLLAIAGKVAGRLDGKPAREVERVVGDEVRSALAELSGQTDVGPENAAPSGAGGGDVQAR